MVIIDESAAVIQPLSPGWYQHKVAGIDMLRLDMLHPVISGNKWYKLKHNLRHAKSKGYENVLTFGGAYSNHLIATAAAANEYGIQAIGIVRGAYNEGVLTPTLVACREAGMELMFITKEEYKKKEEPWWLQKLAAQFNNLFIIPEGGANEWGRAGAEEIAIRIPASYTHVCLPVGTGTTFIGLRNGLAGEQQLLGFVPMKNGTYLKEDIAKHIDNNKNNNWQLFDTWHFGGFGKWNDELPGFMNDFYKINDVPLDIVYTSKMMYGIYKMVSEGYFSPGAHILCVHTGGLQGNAAIKHQLVF
jgi:1-aminocyclopropane-1-carboxylate deaminase